MHAECLVGCDGAHSLVRKGLEIAFPGTTSTSISRLARVTIPAGAATRDGSGVSIPIIGRLAFFVPFLADRGSATIAPADALDRSAPPDLYLVSTHEPRGDAEPTDDLGEEELRASLRRVLAVDLPFTTATAARSVVAKQPSGGALPMRSCFSRWGCHPYLQRAGGSALDIGLTDAIVLAEILSPALRGIDDDTALAAYQDRRHGAAGRAPAHSRIQAALEAADETGDALRGVFAVLLRDHTSARRLAALIEG